MKKAPKFYKYLSNVSFLKFCLKSTEYQRWVWQRCTSS